MISIIICSICPEYLDTLKDNICKTIGVSYEIIAVDNREKKWSIAKAYNYGAKRAKYPYLFFVHEDVYFHSSNWGEVIVTKLLEPDCGVIGFAGSKIKFASYSGWYQYDKYAVNYFYQRICPGIARFNVANAHLEHSFEEVVVLDGMGMFVKKNIWLRYPFDEKLLTGFHCYDLDFTLQIALAQFKNYVCCSNYVLIEHLSAGNMNEEWYSSTIRLHKKWKNLLPIWTDSVNIDDKNMNRNEEILSYDFLYKILRTNCEKTDKLNVLREFWSRPLSWKHIMHSLSCSIKYLTNNFISI